MRLPRVTTRRMMAMVAVVAVILAMVPTARKWDFCRRRAAFHARKEQEFRRLQSVAMRKRGSIRLVPALAAVNEQGMERALIQPRAFGAEPQESIDDGIDMAQAFEKRAEQHAQLKRRFERAAWRPWEPSPAG